jgi:hypothetical protein
MADLGKIHSQSRNLAGSRRTLLDFHGDWSRAELGPADLLDVDAGSTFAKYSRVKFDPPCPAGRGPDPAAVVNHMCIVCRCAYHFDQHLAGQRSSERLGMLHFQHTLAVANLYHPKPCPLYFDGAIVDGDDSHLMPPVRQCRCIEQERFAKPDRLISYAIDIELKLASTAGVGIPRRR